MSELERAFLTSSGATWKKVRGKDDKVYHFKDGTPKSQNAFNAATQHVDYEGKHIEIGIPSNKGPGYERIEVSAQEASAIGAELALAANKKEGNQVMRDPRDTISIEIDGEMVTFDTEKLVDINEKIVKRHGPEAVFKY